MDNDSSGRNITADLYGLSSMKIIHNEESFRFIAISGNKGRQFQVTPAHAKRIKMLLEREIEEYEETNGEIEASLPDNGEEKVTESFGPGFSQG